MDNQSLYELIYTNFNWHPARIKSFAELIFGVIKTKSVKLKELAMHVSSKGNIGAKLAKVERLLTKQEFDFATIGKIIVNMLPSAEKLTIAIDRTNWKFGKNNLNFFVAAIIYGNISLPISWSLLDKKGNSNTAERKELIEQILSVIPKERIEIILADREFIGKDWFHYLMKQEIPFAVRIKKCEQIRHPNGGKVKCGKYFADMEQKEVRSFQTKIYSSLPINITCLQLERDRLILASNVVINEQALAKYKQRWGIERSFRSIKTSGFNIEDTHITDLKKLRKLFAIVSLAVAICIIAGEIKNNMIPIIIKKHGRKLFSLFTYGLDWLNEYFSCKIELHKPQTKPLFELLIDRIKQAWN
jgi:hypothetical protein